MSLSFGGLRAKNLARLPLFKDRKGHFCHDANADPIGSDWALSQWCNAVTGELGEAANLIKKIERGDFTLDEVREDLGREFADVQTYLDLLAHRADVDLGAATIQKWNEVSERVGCDLRLSEQGQESELRQEIERLKYQHSLVYAAGCVKDEIIADLHRDLAAHDSKRRLQRIAEIIDKGRGWTASAKWLNDEEADEIYKLATGVLQPRSDESGLREAATGMLADWDAAAALFDVTRSTIIAPTLVRSLTAGMERLRAILASNPQKNETCGACHHPLWYFTHHPCCETCRSYYSHDGSHRHHKFASDQQTQKDGA